MRSRSAELLVALWVVGVGIASLEDRVSPLSRIRLDIPPEHVALGHALTLVRGLPTDSRVFLLLPTSFEQLEVDIPRDFRQRAWPRKTTVFFGSLPYSPAEYVKSVPVADRVPTFIVLLRESVKTTDLVGARLHTGYAKAVCYTVDWSTPR